MCDTGMRVPYRSAGFMPESLAQRHTQLMHCMARFANAVALLPLAPQSYSLRTSRNANGLPTCRRMSKYFFFVKLKAEICVLPKGRCMLRSMHPPSRTASLLIAYVVVDIELALISAIRHHFFGKD